MFRTLAVCLLFTATAAVSQAEPKRAEAELRACRDGEKISGKASLVEEVTGEGIKQVSVRVEIEGLPDGKHAIHIHEKGVCQPCGDAGGHFDPGPHSHSNPDGNHPFHMGDLINVEIRNGLGVMETTTSRVTLSPGPLSVFDADGSAFIIHDGADTYCPDGVVTGCAGGSRAACGIIKPIN